MWAQLNATSFSCITFISPQKLYNLFFYLKTEVCPDPFKARKVFLLLIVYYIKLRAWKNKNALVLTSCTSGWGNWDSGKHMWHVWGHADGDMERLPHLPLQTPPCLFATSAHCCCCREALLHGQGPQIYGSSLLLLSLLPSLLPSLYMCWDEWFLFYCFWLKTHFVCVLDMHHSTIQYLSSLFINRLWIHPYSSHQYM